MCLFLQKISEDLGTSPLSSIRPLPPRLWHPGLWGPRALTCTALALSHEPRLWDLPSKNLSVQRAAAVQVWDGVSRGEGQPGAPLQTLHPSSFTHQERPVCFQTLPVCLLGCLGLALFSVTPIDVSGVALVESGGKFGSSTFYSPFFFFFFTAQPKPSPLPGLSRAPAAAGVRASPLQLLLLGTASPLRIQSRLKTYLFCFLLPPSLFARCKAFYYPDFMEGSVQNEVVRLFVLVQPIQ